MAPGIGPAVVGILAAGDADFIAVIDAGRTGHGHLPGRQQLQALLARFFGRRHVGAAGLGEDRQDAFDIVAADEVEHGIEIFGRIIFNEPRQFSIHAPRIFDTGHEIQHDGPLGVIHGTVDVIAAEVLPLLAVTDLVRSIFPDFADEDGVGLFLFQRMVELAQEGHGQFIDDVQAPAADAFVQPVFEDAVFAVDDEIHIRRRRLFDIGQVRYAPPRFIVVGILLEAVPFIVRRLLRLIGADAGIVAEAVEVNAVGPGMAEDAVKDDVDACFFGGLAESGKFFIRPQHGVDAEVIGRTVAVIAGTFKNRVEVNRRDSQFLQVRQLFPDTGEVAAEKVVIDDVALAFALAVIRHVVPVAVDDGPFLAVQAACRMGPVAEAVRENLIDDGMFEPVRRVGVLIVDCDLIGRRHLGIFGPFPAEAVVVIAVIDGLMAIVDDEIIPDQAALGRHGDAAREDAVLVRHGHKGFTDIALPQADAGPAVPDIAAAGPEAQDEPAPGGNGTKRRAVIKFMRVVVQS